MMGWGTLGVLVCVAAACSAAVTSSRATTPPVMHPAFKDAGRQSGIQIWRIENFNPVPVPQNQYGKFYTGDSYILLSTVADPKNKGVYSWDIHYWIGSKTTQDESGSAAILAVELDDQLGGGPVQHREAEGHETDQFKSYFKNGIFYLPGGAASGFHHVNTNDPGEKKLYQVKGKRHVRVRQVPIDVKSLNAGDCFILDAGGDVYVYVGTSARGAERVKAIAAANQIRDQDHSGRAKVQVIDGSASQSEVDEFFSKLGSGSPKQVSADSGSETDDEFEKEIDNTVALYKVSDASGSVKMEKVGQKPLSKTLLNTNDAFILDTVKSGIYIWVGRKATTQEKVEALKRGEVFIQQNNYPKWTKMRRVVEGAEPVAFKEYFAEWRDSTSLG